MWQWHWDTPPPPGGIIIGVNSLKSHYHNQCHRHHVHYDHHHFLTLPRCRILGVNWRTLSVTFPSTELLSWLPSGDGHIQWSYSMVIFNDHIQWSYSMVKFNGHIQWSCSRRWWWSFWTACSHGCPLVMSDSMVILNCHIKFSSTQCTIGYAMKIKKKKNV